MNKRCVPIIATAAASLILLLSRLTAVSDSWAPPKEFDSLSDNKEFVAHVTPGTTGKAPLLVVYQLVGGWRVESWQTQLSNRVSPTSVFVSDDGQAVLTMDNWGRGGYGDDVVAIYGRKGQLAKYSLEQFAPPPVPKPQRPGVVSIWGNGYEGKFTHSTSSRHWRKNSVNFFSHEADQLLFTLWLDWDDRWVAWNMGDGKLHEVTKEEAQRWNVEARARALKECQSGKPTENALNLLGRLRLKEDRHWIETWLRDTEFASGSVETSDRSNFSLAYTSRSNKRENADRILGRWDNLSSDDEREWRPYHRYYFLGTLKCSVTFAVALRQARGTVFLYLIPETTPFEQWAKTPPEHYLKADWSYPRYDSRVDQALGQTINFVISGITPGNYRLKAVWYKSAQSYGKDFTLPPLPQSGDYDSIASPVITIKKGEITEGFRLDCTHLVKQ